MTGATGDLTPDEEDRPSFRPSSARSSDPEHQGDVTAAHGRSAPAQHGDIGSPGESHDGGGAPRDGGTGSGHGLSAADPAYRMQSREHSSDDERHRRHVEGEHRRSEGDGDEFGEHEDHF